MLPNIKEWPNAFFHIIQQGIDSMANFAGMSNIESFSNIIVNIVVIIGGVAGILYWKKLRDKQVNATFSYLTQLQVRIDKLYTIYTEYNTEIMERYIPQLKRRQDINAKTPFIDQIIIEFAESSAETLKFLRTTSEQMPASKEWPTYFRMLLEFLGDAEHLSIETFHKWASDEEIAEKRDKYNEAHKNNLKNIIEAIELQQIYLTQKIFKHEFRNGPQ